MVNPSLQMLINGNNYIFVFLTGLVSIFLKLVYPVVDPLEQYEEVPQPKDDRNPLQAYIRKTPKEGVITDEESGETYYAQKI